MTVLTDIRWVPGGFMCGIYSFIQDFSSDIGEAQANYPTFILMKDKANVLGYVDHLANVATDDFLELGIMKGGSCALFEALYKPNNHMAVDIYRHPDHGLSQLAAAVQTQGRRFSAHYDISQADVGRIAAEWCLMTGQYQPQFDVIVDDASHSYDLSLSAFNGLFPYLRPGGVYVVEDWGWAHWNGPWQEPTHDEFKRSALSNLSIHCLIGTTGLGGAISKMIATPNQTFVVRGDIPISTPFDIRSNVLMRGREIFLI